MGVSQSIFKVIKSEVIRFLMLQSLPLFSLVSIHSMSHTYIDALCSILSNFCLHFTRPGPYSISPLVLAGKQKGYDYPTFLTCYKLQEKKRLSIIPLHVLQTQFQCVPLCHDDTHNHLSPSTQSAYVHLDRGLEVGRGVE